MGAKSKWQVDLQDTIDAQAFNAEKWDISCFGGRCNPRCRSEKTVNYFPFFVNFFDIENIWISIVLHNKLLFSFTPRGLIQHRFIFNLFFDFYISPLGAYSREGAYCKKWGLPWGLIQGRGLNREWRLNRVFTVMRSLPLLVPEIRTQILLELDSSYFSLVWAKIV